MSAVVCVELLFTTILAWVGLWGLVEEALSALESKQARCCVYAALLSAALLSVAVQKQLTVCALL